MKKKIIFIILSILLISFVYVFYGNDINEYYFSKHVIYWSKDVNIKVEDFQAEIDKNDNLSISWYHGLFLKANYIHSAKVKAFFDKKKSWIRDTTDFNQQMKLQNLRFALFAAYARKYNKHIDQIRDNKETTYSDLEKIGDRIYIELGKKEIEIFNSKLTIDEKIDKWAPIIEEMFK